MSLLVKSIALSVAVFLLFAVITQAEGTVLAPRHPSHVKIKYYPSSLPSYIRDFDGTTYALKAPYQELPYYESTYDKNRMTPTEVLERKNAIFIQ